MKNILYVLMKIEKRSLKFLEENCVGQKQIIDRQFERKLTHGFLILIFFKRKWNIHKMINHYNNFAVGGISSSQYHTHIPTFLDI